VTRVAELLQREFRDMVERESGATVQAVITPNQEGELPCPACGTAAPLVDGACSDCGLHLE